jgi:hypothetical protein
MVDHPPVAPEQWVVGLAYLLGTSRPIRGSEHLIQQFVPMVV